MKRYLFLLHVLEKNKHEDRKEPKYMKQNLLPVNIVSAKQMSIRMRQVGMGMDFGGRTYWLAAED